MPEPQATAPCGLPDGSMGCRFRSTCKIKIERLLQQYNGLLTTRKRDAYHPSDMSADHGRSFPLIALTPLGGVTRVCILGRRARTRTEAALHVSRARPSSPTFRNGS